MARILIAEDDRFLAQAYKVKFAKANFEIEIAANGEEAVNQIKANPPDLLLLDLVMPNKDGFYVLEYLKQNPPTKKFPVIVASNLGQEEDIKKAQSLGADDYVVKADLPLDKLVEKVRTALGLQA